VLAGVAAPAAPPVTIDVDNTRFPLPKRRWAVDLTLHYACGAELVRLAEDEIAKGYELAG
jgi:hypothetical protein